ncbi:MAG TPA: galactokinase [Phycisphaerales bacterium]|nr:galactokinase [Phycisphaerales bacterium]HRQ75682.1 galactokinase [Phycisphaerales bacterium]
MDPSARAAYDFASRFACKPRWRTGAPGRINLIGEHTDYNLGFALPMAIDRYAAIAAAPAATNLSRLHAADLNETIQLDLTQQASIHAFISTVATDSSDHFAPHLLGVAAQFIKRGHVLPNIDLVLASSIPIGAGLASSAAIKVAMCNLLASAIGISLSPMETALLCQRAEHESVGTPCGIMDMLTSAIAHAEASQQSSHALLLDCQTNHAERIPLPSSGSLAFLVVDTGVKHALAGSEYAVRRRTCEQAAMKLHVSSLRDATMDALHRASLTDEERRCALHVVQENQRTLDAAQALQERSFDRLGEILFAGHQSLRELYQVSCAELDTIVDAARELRESGLVYGARMTGGGFGGCAIVLCPPGHESQIRERIESAFQSAHGRKPRIDRVRAVS